MNQNSSITMITLLLAAALTGCTTDQTGGTSATTYSTDQRTVSSTSTPVDQQVSLTTTGTAPTSETTTHTKTSIDADHTAQTASADSDATREHYARTGSDDTDDERVAADPAGSSDSSAFLKEAALGGLAEVKLGQLAVEKATNAQLKQYGQHLVDDHSKANEKVKSLAQADGVSLPTELDAKHQETYDELAQLSGAEFDKEFVEKSIEMHEKDIAKFKEQARNGKDPEVKSFAANTVPTLEKHLETARGIESSL